MLGEDRNDINQEGEKALKSVTSFARNVLITGLGVGVLAGRKAKEVGSSFLRDVLSSAGEALQNASEVFGENEDIDDAFDSFDDDSELWEGDTEEEPSWNDIESDNVEKKDSDDSFEDSELD